MKFRYAAIIPKLEALTAFDVYLTAHMHAMLTITSGQFHDKKIEDIARVHADSGITMA